MSENVVASTDTGSSPREYNAANGPKAIIKNVDMTEEMQLESVEIATAALEKYNIEKDIAAQIKKEFDRRHGATWHVVVGKNFGSYVTHGACFIMIYVLGPNVRRGVSRPVTLHRSLTIFLAFCPSREGT
jgi:dynein light chain LC8-type